MTNENDENSTATARMTRSKAAATLNADELALPTKALQSKKTATNATSTRQRAALGDVSNVTKVNAVDAKKPAAKAGLVSKAAQPTGIKKTTTTRSALNTKEVSKKVEPKRSGPGSIGAKRKVKDGLRKVSPIGRRSTTPMSRRRPRRK